MTGFGSDDLEPLDAEPRDELVEALGRGRKPGRIIDRPDSCHLPFRRRDPVEITIGTEAWLPARADDLDRDRIEAFRERGCGSVATSSPAPTGPGSRGAGRQRLDERTDDRPEVAGPSSRMAQLDGNDPRFATNRYRPQAQREDGPLGPSQAAAEPLDETREGDRDRRAVDNRTRERRLDNEPRRDRHGRERLGNNPQRLVNSIERRWPGPGDMMGRTVGSIAWDQ